MVQQSSTGTDVLRDAKVAEMTLIDAETEAEQNLAKAEARYRRALEKLERAQLRTEARRKEFEQARARLDQCQLERSAGPLIRRISVARPSLPRPARDDSRVRSNGSKSNEPAPEGAGSSDPESKKG
jgi:hypothetical protein